MTPSASVLYNLYFSLQFSFLVDYKEIPQTESKTYSVHAQKWGVLPYNVHWKSDLSWSNPPWDVIFSKGVLRHEQLLWSNLVKGNICLQGQFFSTNIVSPIFQWRVAIYCLWYLSLGHHHNTRLGPLETKEPARDADASLGLLIPWVPRQSPRDYLCFQWLRLPISLLWS